MSRFRHFKGEYRAWFRTSAAQTVHTSSFFSLHPESIEIRNIRALDHRMPDAERTGDYLHFPLIRARKKSAFARLLQGKATDVVLLASEEMPFSEDLEQVILKGHSGNRLADKLYIREAAFQKINAETAFLAGTIYFSLPVREIALFSQTDTSPITPATTIGNEPPIIPPMVPGTRIDVPDLVLTGGGSRFRMPAMPSFGCFSLIWSLLKWCFYLWLFLSMLGWLGGLLRDKTREEVVETGSGNIESDPPKLNPVQDTLAPMPWDYLTRHRIRWQDFIPQNYLAQYQTSSKEFAASQSMHAHFQNPAYTEALQYWNAVYAEFAGRDEQKLDSLAEVFRAEQQKRNLNSGQTAEMVITFIQEIPYCLIHEGSCAEANKMAGFIAEYHQEGKPCLPNIITGLQSPYEFIHNLKGDCDTRSLLGFSLLSKLGIPASVWVSEAYGHSVLGVGLGSGGTYYKMVGGIRHSAVELTAKGFRLGMISPEQGDMNNWKIALYKNE